MKIYTKTGDDGFTSLIGGTRVPKYHLRIEAYGTVDELNSYVGLIRSQNINEADFAVLQAIQNCLFVIGSQLAAEQAKPGIKIPQLHPQDIELLEMEMDRIDEILPPLKHFILPGGSNAVSFCHLARCVCRRAERLTVELAENSFVDEKVKIYLNRLSDYLFMLARKTGQEQGTAEFAWISRK